MTPPAKIIDRLRDFGLTLSTTCHDEEWAEQASRRAEQLRECATGLAGGVKGGVLHWRGEVYELALSDDLLRLLGYLCAAPERDVWAASDVANGKQVPYERWRYKICRIQKQLQIAGVPLWFEKLPHKIVRLTT